MYKRQPKNKPSAVVKAAFTQVSLAQVNKPRYQTPRKERSMNPVKCNTAKTTTVMIKIRNKPQTQRGARLFSLTVVDCIICGDSPPSGFVQVYLFVFGLPMTPQALLVACGLWAFSLLS